jgi:hypothetical protein
MFEEVSSMAFERNGMAGWLTMSVVAAVFGAAIASCGGDDTPSHGCTVLPCPFPGFDIETCSCRHPDGGPGDAGDDR